ncbi:MULTISPECIES: hypothetical protein [unclassified Microbacterium]|uniref:DUF7620 family protein n=1 Tax=unclassified Microbacterium TaxID=2609290 RepID=UPI00386C78B5
MWGRKPKTEPIEIPDDVSEAREMRAQATAERRELAERAPALAHLTGYLNERRALNHFGESIQITFTRRGHA